MGLPFLPPYLAGLSGQGFRRGANFAVAGATAIENGFFMEKGIRVPWSNNSLGVQIEWFKQLLPSLCSPGSGTPAFFPTNYCIHLVRQIPENINAKSGGGGHTNGWLGVLFTVGFWTWSK